MQITIYCLFPKRRLIVSVAAASADSVVVIFGTQKVQGEAIIWRVGINNGLYRLVMNDTPIGLKSSISSINAMNNIE